MEFQSTLAGDANPVPLMVRMRAGLPATALEGNSAVMVGGFVAIVNVYELDLTPPGLDTVTGTVPAVRMSDAGTGAVTSVADTNVVVSDVPFQFTVEPGTKFTPFTNSVKFGPPAATDAGLSPVITGAADTVKFTVLETVLSGLSTVTP